MWFWCLPNLFLTAGVFLAVLFINSNDSNPPKGDTVCVS